MLPDVLAGAAARPDVPEADALGRDARRRQGRAAVRPADSLDLFLYGGRVVPFTIRRTPAGAAARSCRTSARAPSTYGHRFLTTSGRAGRAIKVKTSTTTASGSPRTSSCSSAASATIASRASSTPRRAGAAAASPRALVGQAHARRSAGPGRVPGRRRRARSPTSSCTLPEEVLTTTMIHHQHFFPVVDDQGKLHAGVSGRARTSSRSKPEVIARNMERVLTARLRDARFFWDADRKQPLERACRAARARCCSTRSSAAISEKAERVEQLARWICAEVFGRPDAADARALKRGRLCKADLATDMVRELTELQGTMGGIYAREDGRPEEVWKAIYYHYLPVGVEADGAADARAARRGGDHLGGRVAGRQARHRRSACSRRASGRPARAIRTACAAPRRGSCASWSTCRS